MSLADETVRGHPRNELPADQPGRRLRVLAGIVWARTLECDTELLVGHCVLARVPGRPTYASALTELEGHAALGELPLRQPQSAGSVAFVTRLDQITAVGSNPSVTECLQDLANEWFVDVHEACAAFDDPEMWYPGVDEGIEPVSDDHVRLVIAAVERELSRELRPPQKQVYTGSAKLPFAPLHELPWRVQRALAERRRLRYAQWGIGRAEWERGTWSLWDVPEDPAWLPRWPVGEAAK